MKRGKSRILKNTVQLNQVSLTLAFKTAQGNGVHRKIQLMTILMQSKLIFLQQINISAIGEHW